MTNDGLSEQYIEKVREIIYVIETTIATDPSLSQAQILDALFSCWIHYVREYNAEARTIAAMPYMYETINKSRLSKMQ